jgi:hypothetical protein
MTGREDTLRLETVYLPAPIPRNLAVLTVLGVVFDKVYFPGVYLPKDGYDAASLDKEIERIENLPVSRDYDTQILLGVLRLTKYAKTLSGFCEFTADPDDVFGEKRPISQDGVRAIYDALHGLDQ